MNIKSPSLVSTGGTLVDSCTIMLRAEYSEEANAQIKVRDIGAAKLELIIRSIKAS